MAKYSTLRLDMHTMNNFLRHNDVFMDTTIMNESKLVRSHNTIHIEL